MKNSDNLTNEKLLNFSMKFNPTDELHSTLRRLEMTMTKPERSFFIIEPKEEARIAKQQYARAIAQIDLAQEQYLQRLELAKKERAIDEFDFIKARMNVSDMFGPFSRMRDEVRESYREIVGFNY